MYIEIDENNYVTLAVESDVVLNDSGYLVSNIEIEHDIDLYKYDGTQIVLDEDKKAQREEEQELETLRQRRQTECFAICDRACWYDTLTQEQKEEVKQWREAWLEVTETKVIPTKPSFIENS